MQTHSKDKTILTGRDALSHAPSISQLWPSCSGAMTMPLSQGRGKAKATSNPVRPQSDSEDFISDTTPDSEEEPLSPEGDNPEPDTNLLLANAILNLNRGLHKLRRPSSTKVKDPEPFDGTNPSKLREFLVSCSLVFSDRPDSFRKDIKKVRYVISYLKGSALDWFEPVIMGDVDEAPDWLHDFPAFVQELTDHFGPYDFRGDAETALNNLVMKDHHHVTKYIVDFNKLASRTDWNEPALRDRFFRGLPNRIRTELLRGGKPKTLTRMRLKAQQIDQAHWMSKDEIAMDSKTMPTSDDTKDDNSEHSSSSLEHSAPDSDHLSMSNSNPHLTLPELRSPSEHPDISDKLDEDGRLKADERKRRLDKDLCLYCGAGGHTAKDCQKAPSTYGRAAVVSYSPTPLDSETQPSTPESSDSEK